MGRSRLATLVILAVLALGLAARPAGAQSYTGLLTGHLGASHGGDIRGARVTFGATLAVIEDGNGLGVELDVAHTASIGDDRFTDSGVTSGMLNFVASYPKPLLVRPYLSLGAGVLHVRAEGRSGEGVVSRTDFGFNAGAGAAYPLNEMFEVRGDVRYFRFFEGHSDLAPFGPGPFDYWRTSIGLTFHWPVR